MDMARERSVCRNEHGVRLRWTLATRIVGHRGVDESRVSTKAQPNCRRDSMRCDPSLRMIVTTTERKGRCTIRVLHSFIFYRQDSRNAVQRETELEVQGLRPASALSCNVRQSDSQLRRMLGYDE
jgi:hypothetical protein